MATRTKPAPDAEEGKPLWLTTPEEYAAQEVGRWEIVPRDRTEAMLRQGVRKQVTREAAMAQHRAFIETALEWGYPVAVASIQFHKLALPAGYVQDTELFVKRKCKLPKTRVT